MLFSFSSASDDDFADIRRRILRDWIKFVQPALFSHSTRDYIAAMTIVHRCLEQGLETLDKQYGYTGKHRLIRERQTVQQAIRSRNRVSHRVGYDPVRKEFLDTIRSYGLALRALHIPLPWPFDPDGNLIWPATKRNRWYITLPGRRRRS